ncbi:hypothetical protein C0Q70_06887 [Pomacea canaliculata]|uniref:Uncharacterized protein n=1 Tax=Pomacea canaliculata TaxID=400727 RepID=A0A2T7PDI1_POMCA|nr:hypothetical protein C0Q70_06887 [Pomacea canaliculata]
MVMPPRQSQRLNHTGYLSTGKYTPHTSTTIVDEVLTARANKLLHWGRDGEDCSLPVDRACKQPGRAGPEVCEHAAVCLTTEAVGQTASLVLPPERSSPRLPVVRSAESLRWRVARRVWEEKGNTHQVACGVGRKQS